MFSQDTRNQQVSAYNHSFITVIQSYDSKQTSVGLLYTEKIDDVVLLNVFKKGFSASPLDCPSLLNGDLIQLPLFERLEICMDIKILHLTFSKHLFAEYSV